MVVEDSTSPLNFILVLGIGILLVHAFDIIIRKRLKVERKKFFSYNYVNEKHKKIDITIRIIAAACILLTIPLNMTRAPGDADLYFQPWVIIIIFLSITEIVRAVMERKYAENPNAFKVTISNYLFSFTIFALVLYLTGFFKLL
ncbi:DUF4181 domain-containing protein [Litchfieldia salsa]|uniref:DUF4181 domain-containing protein n=1 Tax=Litchfieldia salsa TaxID=930152 RepID=A0A1H0W8B3_9BACI|nr:DUF4181 domain-containing protein [Litchfieldia salsa]SDP86526.1 protein of unknown function [Litchfieldia salsa]